MNAFAKLVLAIAGAVGACVAVVSIASVCLVTPGSHRFDGLSASDLWTTEPVRIDRDKENYERLPPVYSSYVTDAPKVKNTVEQPALVSMKVPLVPSELPSAHLNWCAEHYRSYNSATDTYRAFNGELRTCISPNSSQQPTAGVKKDQAVRPAQDRNTVNRAVEAWCTSRHQSYRAYDRPYDRPRRPCAPASAVIASLGDSRH
jgi:hypothetical protein